MFFLQRSSVQIVCLSIKTNCPPAQNVKETHEFHSCLDEVMLTRNKSYYLNCALHQSLKTPVSTQTYNCTFYTCFQSFMFHYFLSFMTSPLFIWLQCFSKQDTNETILRNIAIWWRRTFWLSRKVTVFK